MAPRPIAYRLTVLALGVLLALGGCGHREEPESPSREPATGAAPPPSGDTAAQAETIFTSRCVPCHGPRGAGDGPASAGLEPKPRNFQDTTWQSSVTDEHIARIIQFGGSAVGKSGAMPGNPDLQDKQAVVMALVAYVRSLSN